MTMISLIHISCPHCLRENAVLEVMGEALQPLKKTHALMAICRSCSGGLIAEVELGYDVQMYDGFFKYAARKGCDILLDCHYYSNEWGTVKRTYPRAKKHEAPDATPERIGGFFIEAKENFDRGYYETCGGLCRKVIDLATKYIAKSENIDAWKLHKRMEVLKNKGVITQQMYDWADIVRLDGNEQTHSEDDFDQQSAKTVLDFTETFLLYAFTLPDMVATKRAASEKPTE